MKNITFFKFSLVGKNRGPEDKANFGYKLVRLATSKDNPNLNINEDSS